MDNSIELIFLEELTAQIVAALDDGGVTGGQFAAMIENAAQQGRVPSVQVAFARFTHYQYTTDFLEDQLATWSWAPYLTRLVDNAGGHDEDALTDAIDAMYTDLSNQDMWELTEVLCHLGNGLFQFTGGFPAFLRSCHLHGQAVVDRERQSALAEPAALITAMVAAGHGRAAAEFLARYALQWDLPALFTLWLAVTVKLVPDGELGILTLDPDGVPSSVTRNTTPASEDQNTPGSGRLLIDAITATRDKDRTAVLHIISRIQAMTADDRFDTLVELANLTGSAYGQGLKR